MFSFRGYKDEKCLYSIGQHFLYQPPLYGPLTFTPLVAYRVPGVAVDVGAGVLVTIVGRTIVPGGM